MSMLTITGKVLHIFEKPPVKKGEETLEAKPQIQLLGQIPLPNGETRYDLVTLSTDNPEAFHQFKNSDVRVPVGVFSPAKGQTVFFIPKGSLPVQA